MVSIKLGLLLKMQAQSKKFSYLINHAKNVETKVNYTIKSEGVEVIQVVVLVLVLVISIYTKWVLVICKNISSKK